jgi:hypothetical protein
MLVGVSPTLALNCSFHFSRPSGAARAREGASEEGRAGRITSFSAFSSYDRSSSSLSSQIITPPGWWSLAYSALRRRDSPIRQIVQGGGGKNSPSPRVHRWVIFPADRPTAKFVNVVSGPPARRLQLAPDRRDPASRKSRGLKYNQRESDRAAYGSVGGLMHPLCRARGPFASRRTVGPAGFKVGSCAPARDRF